MTSGQISSLPEGNTFDRNRPRRGSHARAAYPVPDKLNAAVLMLQLVCIAGCFVLTRTAESLAGALFAAGCFAVVMNAVYSTIHEAHHRMLFSNRLLNDGFGIALATLFPAPFHLLRQGHLGHHRRNRSDDEAFDLYFARDNILWKHIAWYGILTGGYYLLVVVSNVLLLVAPMLFDPKRYRWDRTSEVFLEHFSPASFSAMRAEAAAAIIVQSCLFLAAGVSWQQYALLYGAFGLLWSSLQYVHHYEAERDVIEGAHNLYLWRPLDLFWLNHNWHKTHHQLPTVPWCYLPSIAEQAETKSRFLLPAYLRMWRGPRFAEPGVKNRFEGKVAR